MKTDPVALTLTPELAHTLYETLKFYANRFSYKSSEGFPDAFGRRQQFPEPTIDELVEYARSTLVAWDATRPSRAAPPAAAIPAEVWAWYKAARQLRIQGTASCNGAAIRACAERESNSRDAMFAALRKIKEGK